MVRSQIRRSTATSGTEASVVDHLADSVFARSLSHDLANLRRTIGGLDLGDLDRAVAVLDRAERLFVVGSLGSYAAAHFAAVALDRLRGSTFALDGNDYENATRLADLSERDALVTFTFAPYAKSALRLVHLAKRRKTPLIAITDTSISPVGQQVDIVLPAVSSGVSTHNSLIGAMAVANALINGLMVVRSGQALERYDRTARLLNEWDLLILKGDE